MNLFLNFLLFMMLIKIHYNNSTLLLSLYISPIQTKAILIKRESKYTDEFLNIVPSKHGCPLNVHRTSMLVCLWSLEINNKLAYLQNHYFPLEIFKEFEKSLFMWYTFLRFTKCLMSFLSKYGWFVKLHYGFS